MTQETQTAFVAIEKNGVRIGADWSAEPTMVLQIGRTGEKAKYQGRLVTIDLSALPTESVRFALEYGLKQYIADGTAGSEDQTGYDVGIDQRLRKLAEGDFTRASAERGPKADTAEGRAKKLAVAAIRSKLEAAGQKADAKAINEAAGKMVAAQPVWLERARKALAEEAKMAAATDIDDILADMLGLVDTDEG